MKCLFCKMINEKEFVEVIHLDRDFISFYDPNPVSKGHALIVPKIHRNSLADLTGGERRQFFDMLEIVQFYIDKRYHPNGYNIGANEGTAAGQTISHLHVHVIPRYDGDVPNPRGGIRNIIPGKGDYTKQ
jgi:ATP adenylyltransferase